MRWPFPFKEPTCIIHPLRRGTRKEYSKSAYFFWIALQLQGLAFNTYFPLILSSDMNSYLYSSYSLKTCLCFGCFWTAMRQNQVSAGGRILPNCSLIEVNNVNIPPRGCFKITPKKETNEQHTNTKKKYAYSIHSVSSEKMQRKKMRRLIRIQKSMVMIVIRI